MSYYPQNIGIQIPKSQLTTDQIEYIKTHLPAKTILRIYGLGGVGKGTLSKNLASFFNLPDIDSGLLWRAVTYIILEANEVYSDALIETIFANLKCSLVDLKLQISYQNRLLQTHELRSPMVDMNVASFSKIEYARTQFYKAVTTFILQQLHTGCILDGRSPYTPYIRAAEAEGFKIIRILLDTDIDIKAQRRFQEYLQRMGKTEADFTENPNARKELFQDCKQKMIARDQQDINTGVSQNMGLVSKDTGIIDTTHLTIEEVFQTALSFIFTQLF
jgi:cytidylate kinase